MSGIFGFFDLRNDVADTALAEPMAQSAASRGPDGIAIWQGGPFVLGVARNDVTPESAFETLPHVEGDLAIVADIRLDNREELIERLKLKGDPLHIGDHAIVVAAYREWGEHCVERLQGDFAFAIADLSRRELFCARDRMGQKVLCHAHVDGIACMFGSDARIVAANPLCPQTPNEVLFLGAKDNLLEGMDRTSTFFTAVRRLEPAHRVSVSANGVQNSRYWQLEPAAVLQFKDENEYDERFRELLSAAVRARLRGGRNVGAMLSGGMDSSSICAFAAPVQAAKSGSPLKTFSAIDSADPENPETIHAKLASEFLGCDAHFADLARPKEWMDAVLEARGRMVEPFDDHMNLMRAVYATARAAGVKSVLSGGMGDTMFSPGPFVGLLARKFEFRRAWQEHHSYWSQFHRPPTILMMFLRQNISAFSPAFVLEGFRELRSRTRLADLVRSGVVSKAEAEELDLLRCLRTIATHDGDPTNRNHQRYALKAIFHPNQQSGMERYDRVASEFGMEVREPYNDPQLAAFFISLPWDQNIRRGQSKLLARRALRGMLPAEILDRSDKCHLGATFTRNSSANVTFRDLH